MVLNPKGRAKALPDWFVERGPDMLKLLLAHALGESEDKNWSQFDAVDQVIERIYGKTPQAKEDQDAALHGFAAMVAAIATGRNKLPDDE